MCLGKVTRPVGRSFSRKSSAARETAWRRRNRLWLRQQNCLGLKTDGKIRELAYLFKDSQAFAACLQETWREGSELFDKFSLSSMSNAGREALLARISKPSKSSVRALGRRAPGPSAVHDHAARRVEEPCLEQFSSPFEPTSVAVRNPFLSSGGHAARVLSDAKTWQGTFAPCPSSVAFASGG